MSEDCNIGFDVLEVVVFVIVIVGGMCVSKVFVCVGVFG